MNTWPRGRRHAMTQGEHARWNARNYPGTQQLCGQCGEPTGRCEEDSLYADDDGGTRFLCEQCNEQKDLFSLAHELWAVAQVMPHEGIEDAVLRIVDLLKTNMEETSSGLNGVQRNEL